MYEIWEVTEVKKGKLYALKELWTKVKTTRNLIYEFYYNTLITGRPKGNKFFVYLEKGQKLNDSENPVRLKHYPFDGANIATFSWIDGKKVKIKNEI